MSLAGVFVVVILAVTCSDSAVLKLRRDERVVASVHKVVGIPIERFPALAALELLGAAGLLLGLWAAPIGIVAAIGLTSYFAVAVFAHIRAGDTAGSIRPVIPLVLSVNALLILALGS